MRFTDQTRRDLCRSVAECYSASGYEAFDPIEVKTGSNLLVLGVMIKYLEEAIIDRLEMLPATYADRDREFLDQFVMESIGEITDQLSKSLAGLLPQIVDAVEAEQIILDCHRIEQVAHGVI